MTPSAVLLDLDGTLVDTPSTMRDVVVQTMEDMVGELPEAVRRAIADRWIADPARHFYRYEIGEITFADQRRARLPGDSLVADVEGALAAGLEAGWTEPVMGTAVGCRWARTAWSH